jgi:effector-binding domain-containing protein
MPADISIKFFMPMKVASTEKKGPREEMGKVLEQITQVLKEKKVKLDGDPMALLQGDAKGMDLQKAQFEVCLPISGKVKGAGEVKGKELEKGAFACITHSGPLEKLPEAYQEILKWAEENGYRIVGQSREVHLKGLGGSVAQPEECLIELQFPVRKG